MTDPADLEVTTADLTTAIARALPTDGLYLHGPSIGSLAERIAAALQASFVLVPKGQLHQEWGWDVKGRKKPNPTLALGRDGRPATQPPKLLSELRLYSRQVGPWRPTDSKEG